MTQRFTDANQVPGMNEKRCECGECIHLRNQRRLEAEAWRTLRDRGSHISDPAIAKIDALERGEFA